MASTSSCRFLSRDQQLTQQPSNNVVERGVLPQRVTEAITCDIRTVGNELTGVHHGPKQLATIETTVDARNRDLSNLEV